MNVREFLVQIGLGDIEITIENGANLDKQLCFNDGERWRSIDEIEFFDDKIIFND